MLCFCGHFFTIFSCIFGKWVLSNMTVHYVGTDFDPNSIWKLCLKIRVMPGKLQIAVFRASLIFHYYFKKMEAQ